MATPTPAAIACLYCDDDAVRSLRAILTMLKPSLGRDWEVKSSVSHHAALHLVNLDHPEGAAALASLDAGTRAIGCALHPRRHPPGTIHYRPFRSYELFSTLKQIERLDTLAAPGNGAATPAEEDQARSFKLTYWPDEFEKWPHEWWPVLASLRSSRLNASALAQQLNLSAGTVNQCLDRLQRLHAVDVEFDRKQASAPREVAGVWQKLGSRLAGLLRAPT